MRARQSQRAIQAPAALKNSPLKGVGRDLRRSGGVASASSRVLKIASCALSIAKKDTERNARATDGGAGTLAQQGVFIGSAVGV